MTSGPSLAGHELRLVEARWRWVAMVLPGVALTALHGTALDLPRADLVDAMDSDRYRVYWIIGAYLFGAATGMAMTGFWSGRLGLRGCYLRSLLLFTLASSACGLAGTEAQMAPLRLAAGYGAGLVISSAMVLLWQEFPEDKELAMALYGMGLYLASVLGSSLGGFLVHAFSWRALFLANLPAGLLIFFLGRRVHRAAPEEPGSPWKESNGAGRSKGARCMACETLRSETYFSTSQRRRLSGTQQMVPFQRPARRPGPFDLTGFLLFAGWVLCMIVVVVMGNEWGWFCSPAFTSWFLALAAVFAGFTAWGILSPRALISLRPLAERNFGLGLCLKALFAVNLYPLLGLLSSYMILLRGYQWWQGALVFLPGFFSMLAAMLAGARWGRDRDRKARMFLGMLGMALMTWHMGSHADLYWSKARLALAFFLWAACAGLVVGPAMLTIFYRFPAGRMAYAAGVFNIFRTLPAFAVGCLLLTLLTRVSDARFDRLRQDITRHRPLVVETHQRMASHFSARGSGQAREENQARALMARWVQANAQALAYRAVLKRLALITAAGALLALWLHPPHRVGRKPPALAKEDGRRAPPCPAA